MLQHAVTVALIHEKIGKNPERMSQIKPFIDKHNWEGINSPSEKHDWRKFEKSNPIMFCMLKVCENSNFCNVVMPAKDTKILEFNQYYKSDKASFTIFAELESLIEKIDGCKNNPEKSSTAKVGKHIPSGFRFFKVYNIVM